MVRRRAGARRPGAARAPTPPRAPEPAALSEPAHAFEPRLPALVATLVFSVGIVVLSIPMLSGAFLAGPFSDQYASGYAYRAWAAEWWRRLGHVPLWNPEIFGGMPFLAGMSGDVLYPTAWLRLVMPTHVAMNLGFAVHYLLAGLFMYAFLRRWRVSWAGSVVGGLTYELSGVVGSYVSPGHDGKLFVTALLPLLLLALTLGVRDRRIEAYGLAALAVGLIMLSPHPQMAEYALLAAGLFTLFLVFGTGERTLPGDRLAALGLALAAVVVGVAVSAAQYLPFLSYLPYSPRDTSAVAGFEWSSAYAIPWLHLPELVIPRFTGESFNGSYWGPNGIKLHSEYLGLVSCSLAVVGATVRERRGMVRWLLGIAALFLLVALGASTPFYRLWWEVVPFAKSMRAPGMALFIVSFVTATLAAFGTDRLLAVPSRRFSTVAVTVGAAVALLGLSGALGVVVESSGRTVEASTGLQGRAGMARLASENLPLSALLAGAALLLTGITLWLRRSGAAPLRLAVPVLLTLVGADLWLNTRVFWQYSRSPDELFGGDAIKAYLSRVRAPYRVWDVRAFQQGIDAVYPDAALMVDDVPQLYGHHGNEPHAFDVLSGRIGSSLQFSREGFPRVLDLFAVNHLIVRTDAAPDSIAGFRRVVDSAMSSAGVEAALYERVDPVPYARLVGSASAAPLERSAAQVLNPDFRVERVIVLDSAIAAAAGVTARAAPDSQSVPGTGAVSVTAWVPGRMRLHIADRTTTPAYVMVSENWDAPWRARVDGRDAPVLRGDVTLLTVPVPAGAREVELWYESASYERGRALSLLALLAICAAIVAPMIVRRIRTSR